MEARDVTSHYDNGARFRTAIPTSSIQKVRFNPGRQATLTTSKIQGHFSHLILRFCVAVREFAALVKLDPHSILEPI